MSGNLNVLLEDRLAKIKMQLSYKEKQWQDGLASGETGSILRRCMDEIDALKTKQRLLEQSCYLMDKEDARSSRKPASGDFQNKYENYST